MRTLIIGRTHVGKTLFCIQFAKYLGLDDLNWAVQTADGQIDKRRWSVSEARASLVGNAPHHTRALQTLHLQVPKGKIDKHVFLTDSTGLTDGIHPDASLRDAMAQTLRMLIDADVILHVVDAQDIGKRGFSSGTRGGVSSHGAWSDLDEQVAVYASSAHRYALLANKMDLPDAKKGYQALCKQFSRQKVFPVSALRATGFREVKQHVWRLA